MTKTLLFRVLTTFGLHIVSMSGFVSPFFPFLFIIPSFLSQCGDSATCRAVERKVQYYTTCPPGTSETIIPSSLSIPLFYTVPPTFTCHFSMHDSIWSEVLFCYKAKILLTRLFSALISRLLHCVCVCAWHMADIMSRDCG